jgi:hypothetical protein
MGYTFQPCIRAIQKKTVVCRLNISVPCSLIYWKRQRGCIKLNHFNHMTTSPAVSTLIWAADLGEDAVSCLWYRKRVCVCSCVLLRQAATAVQGSERCVTGGIACPHTHFVVFVTAVMPPLPLFPRDCITRWRLVVISYQLHRALKYK